VGDEGFEPPTSSL